MLGTIFEESRGGMKTGNLTSLKRIRKHCVIDCSGGSRKEVRLCQAKECYLYPLRMGHNLARKGIGPGSREKNGRFQRKGTGSAGSSGMASGSVDNFESRTSSGSLEAPSKKLGWSGISVNKTGQIEVRETKEGLLIKIISDQA